MLAKVTLTTLGAGCEISLAVGDWVEIVNDGFVLLSKPGPLRKIIAIDQIDRVVTLDGEVKDISTGNPLLRRWDFKPVKGSKPRNKPMLRMRIRRCRLKRANG